MGEQFTGTFVLDDSQAQSTIAKSQTSLVAQEIQIANNRHRLNTYFQWAMHMANIWGNYLARHAESQAAIAKYGVLNQALNIMGAELSIGLTIQRGLSDISMGFLGAGYYQLAIAASMQFIMADMQNLQRKQEEAAALQTNAVAWFQAYGGNG